MKIRKIVGKVKRALIFLIDYPEDRKCQKIANYNVAGKYKRVYLYHIRKTGGTSLNNMFLSLADDDKNLYKKLNRSLSQRFISNGFVIQGWNPLLIERGHFFYGFSHLPSHQLNLKSDTFTITCLRDPYKRIVSLYNMLIDQVENDPLHPGLKSQKQWLGNSFSDFIDRVPKYELLNQLYMFSENYDIDEAVKKIKSLGFYFFTESFDSDIIQINKILDLSLKPIHVRKASTAISLNITPDENKRLNKMLAPEIELLEKLQYSKS